MGRGVGFKKVGLRYLGRGWLKASVEGVARVDEKRVRFRQTMFYKYKLLAAATGAAEASGARSPKSVKAKFDEFAADIRKICASLRFVKTPKPTGVPKDQIMYM